MDINRCIDIEIEEINRIKKTIDSFLKDAPDGILKTSMRKNGTVYYYEKNDNGKCKYLHRDEVDSAKALATKAYYMDLLRIIERQEGELKRFRKIYDGDEKYRAYSKLSSARKDLIKPLFMTPSDRVELWKAKTCEPERTSLTVSEMYLASLFSTYTRQLLYRCHPVIRLKDPDETVVPAFELISIRTGKSFLWEHAGHMSDDDYVGTFLSRIDHYARNGYIAGKNLIITYESEGNPLNRQTVSEYIRKLII